MLIVGKTLSPGSAPLFENIGNGETINEICENTQGKYHHDDLEESGKLAKEGHVIHWATIHGYRTYTEAKGRSFATFHSTTLLHSTRPLRHPLFAIPLIGLHLLIKHLLLLGPALRTHLTLCAHRGRRRSIRGRFIQKRECARNG